MSFIWWETALSRTTMLMTATRFLLSSIEYPLFYATKARRHKELKSKIINAYRVNSAMISKYSLKAPILSWFNVVKYFFKKKRIKMSH
jgi:hypothetical protein